MSAKPISQREARALRKRVKDLETANATLRRSMGSEYAGRWMMRIATDIETRSVARTAARLGYVLVARLNYDGDALNFYAIATETPSNV